MTEQDLQNIAAKTTQQFAAKSIVEAWESRFPDILSENSRYYLYHFILNEVESILKYKDL